MDRTIRLLLKPAPEQAGTLMQTVEQFTCCFNHVCAVGWQAGERNGVSLHKATYYDLRERYPDLPSNLTIQARVKATEAVSSALALKRKGRKVSQPKSLHCPVRYNLHTFRVNWSTGEVNLSSVAGRLVIPFQIPKYALKYAGFKTCTADLISRKGKFWLHVVVDIPAPQVAPSSNVIGVDLGITRPAVTSNNRFLGESRWKELEAKTFRLKRKLQVKDTRSSRRHLKRLSGKQLRRRRNQDHILSKQIVQAATPGGTIVLENLTDIRKQVKQRKGKQSRRLHSWSFAQLRSFVEYKAEERGISVASIDPRNTSKTCSRCGHVHRRNRPSQSVFLCKCCGFELNADLNASRNIRLKYLANVGKPDVSEPSSAGLS